VLSITSGDIQNAAGSVQLCAGQIAGVEAAVHAVRECFQEDDVEAAMLVDASNPSIPSILMLPSITYASSVHPSPQFSLTLIGPPLIYLWIMR